ncbi:MAG: HupE/UreJ family protein [Pseudomonadota bacterium]
MKRFRQLLLLVWAVLTCAAPAAADVFSAGQYSFVPDEHGGTHYAFSVQIPLKAMTSVEPVWPEGCQVLDFQQRQSSKSLYYTYVLDCPQAFAPDTTLYAPWPVDAVSFSALVEGRSIRRSFPGGITGVYLPVGDAIPQTRSLSESVGHFIWQGIVHIWIGWDHLAFVLCLCLLASGRRLIWLITAFTLGHSLSLALSYLDIIRIAIAPVEAVIALSIVLMAREAIGVMRGQAAGAGTGRMAFIVVAFGLIHGLGFASALGALGVAQSERIVALIFFNIGVEVGQLMFVAVIAAALAAFRLVHVERMAAFTAAVAAGAIGAYWTIERVSGFAWGA